MSVQIPKSSRIAYVHNNPGNLIFAGQGGAVAGEAKLSAGGDPTGAHWAKFSSPDAGYSALRAQIQLDAGRGHTLVSFINKYAPPTENDTGGYVNQIAQKLGVDINAKLTDVDINSLTSAMAMKESSTVTDGYIRGKNQITKTNISENFAQKVDDSRKKNFTDTQILDYIGSRDNDLKQKIDKSRAIYSQSDIVSNDRDLVNWLAQKYSSKKPSVPSVPDEAEKKKLDLETKIALLEKQKGVEPGTFINELRSKLEAKQRMDELGIVGKTVDEVNKALQKYLDGESSMPEYFLQAGGAVFRGAGETIFKAGVGILKILAPKSVEKWAAKKAEEKIKEFFNTDFGRDIFTVLSWGQESYDAWAKDHPRLAANAEAVLNIGEVITMITGMGASKKLVRKGLSKYTTKLIPSRKVSLEKTLMPKLTAAERTRLIGKGKVAEGRRKIFGGKKPDIITPEQKLKDIAETVREVIPGAEKIKPFELVKRMKVKIEEVAKSIGPQLDELKFSSKNRKELFEEWEYIKKLQLDDPDIDLPGVKNFQKQFEKYLSQAKKGQKDSAGKFREWTMSDMWNLRIKYDDLVKSNVKNATEVADTALQYKKEMWLQNRDMLNQFLVDAVDEAGGDLPKQFKTMSNLYKGIDNIAGRGEIDIVGSPGVLRRWLFKVSQTKSSIRILAR